MNPTTSFCGFPKNTLTFLRDLKRNNDREWFTAHRGEYEEAVMAPARAFVMALGARLRRLAPAVRFEPRVNGSIFRVQRDTRFSADKTPYKTNLGIYFWEGAARRIDSSGFYFHVEPPILLLGGGMYAFTRPFRALFRRAVADPAIGPELAAIVRRIAARPGFAVEGARYKRLPAGFDADPETAPLLLHDGLYAGWEGRMPPELHSPALVDFCHEKFKVMLPLHRWLCDLASGKIKP